MDYEQDLKDALLQSKISYEETRRSLPPETGIQNGGQEKRKGGNKGGGGTTLSLEEFNNLSSDRLQNLHLNGGRSVPQATPAAPPVTDEQDIFDQVALESKKVLERERRRELLERSSVSRLLAVVHARGWNLF